ncbi:Phox homologous domain-containing protein [Dichotomocladium elegans]|nr:Phox homologous domain-containing protein [Dichotomocladium elegans]
MDFQSHIDSLMKQCTESISVLQGQKSLLASAAAVQQLIIQDLQLGMQRLIQLRNALEAIPQDAQNIIWAENTAMVIDQVRAQLHHALQVVGLAHYQETSAAPMLIRSSSSSSSSSSISSSSSFSTSPDNSMMKMDTPISNQSAILIHGDYHKQDANDHRLAAALHLWIPFRKKADPAFMQRSNERDLSPRNSHSSKVDDPFATDAIVDQPLRIGSGHGSYVCYNCTVLSDKAPAISIRKRYSEFVDLRHRLLKHYPHLKTSIPKLPPKRVVGKFTPAFVERRRRDLEYFFKYVVLHPTLGSSSLVTDWIAP